MAESDSNAELQRDEVEALTAIYGEDWCVVDVLDRIYCIQINDGLDRPVWSVCLQICMPENYPMEAPPEYQLNAPWLRGEERRIQEAKLADVYCENVGESIVYLWVEKIREFLQEKTSESPSGSGDSQRLVTVSTETDHGDEDFNLSDLGSFESNLADNLLDISDDWECPTITHGDTVSDRRSTFQPHLAPISHKSQIKMVMDKLYENKKIANATHNILAYRMCQSEPKPVSYQGCDDDGETHAGSRMLHLLKILDANNVLVIVSRWYGGIHLGPDRFKHINNCTRTILEQCGYIHDKEEKKGPKSSDKKRR